MSNRTDLFRQYAEELSSALNSEVLAGLETATQFVEAAYHDRQTIFVAGNGGSAATASHMTADFQKTTLGKIPDQLPKRLRAIALSDNMPVVTAWGNDFHYDRIFAEQLRTLANPGDLLIVITASGNSPNIIAALEAAREIGVKTVGFLGFTGGKAKALCDVSVVVPSENYGVIEDAHSIFMHMVTAAVRETVHQTQVAA